MTDALSILRDRISKAETRASKAEKAWESAKTELADLQTALRVMSNISGESIAPSGSAAASSAAVSERQMLIVKMLGVGDSKAKPPADLFKSYDIFAAEPITIDTFRTTIWRMKGNRYAIENGVWLVKGDNGLYWREEVMPLRPSNAEQIDASFDEEYDDNAPF